jgi:hypothetical protein
MPLEAADIEVTRLTTPTRATTDGGFYEAVPGFTDAP